MSKRSKKRPADVIGNAVRVMEIATGQMKDEDSDDGKDPAAVDLGRRGGKKGGIARASKLSAKRRSEIARKAAAVRWKNSKEKSDS